MLKQSHTNKLFHFHVSHYSRHSIRSERLEVLAKSAAQLFTDKLQESFYSRASIDSNAHGVFQIFYIKLRGKAIAIDLIKRSMKKKSSDKGKYFLSWCLPSEPGLANGQRIHCLFTARSLTIDWQFTDLAILWLRTVKKHLKHCNYDSVARFDLGGLVINTIVLFFSYKKLKNIIYLSLKAEQWFIICGMFPPSGSVIGRSEIKSSKVVGKRDVPQMVNHCSAFNDRYMMFFNFL